MHVLPNSKDDAFNIIDESEVECLSLDPDTIKLNDGSGNLERIQTSESTEWDTASQASTMYRPISNNYKSNSDQMKNPDNKSSDRKKKRNRKNDAAMEYKTKSYNEHLFGDSSVVG